MIRVMFRLAPMLALLSGCSRTEAPPAPATSTPAPTAPAASLAPTASQILDGMDQRTPVPLLPMMANHQKQNMREHLEAVQEIVAALAVEDYDAIAKAAGRIGFSEPMGQMCNHMGAGAPAFAEQALAFHRTADRIGAAAKARDKTKVLTELGVTMKACTGCHATWKQQVVDEATWQRVTATAPPMHMHGEHASP
jgi:hypothetical protein